MACTACNTNRHFGNFACSRIMKSLNLAVYVSFQMYSIRITFEFLQNNCDIAS